MKDVFGLKKKFEAFKEEREEKKKAKKRAKETGNELTGDDAESNAEITPEVQSTQNSQEANVHNLPSGDDKGTLSLSPSFSIQPAPESPSKADLPEPLANVRYMPTSTLHSVEGVGIPGKASARPSTSSASPLTISVNSGFERASVSGVPPSTGHPMKKVLHPVKMMAAPPRLSLTRVDDNSLIFLENSKVPPTPLSGGKKLMAKKMIHPPSGLMSMNNSIEGHMVGKVSVPSGGSSPSLTKVAMPPAMMALPSPRKSVVNVLQKKNSYDAVSKLVWAKFAKASKRTKEGHSSTKAVERL